MTFLGLAFNMESPLLRAGVAAARAALVAKPETPTKKENPDQEEKECVKPEKSEASPATWQQANFLHVVPLCYLVFA